MTTTKITTTFTLTATKAGKETMVHAELANEDGTVTREFVARWRSYHRNHADLVRRLTTALTAAGETAFRNDPANAATFARMYALGRTG